MKTLGLVCLASLVATVAHAAPGADYQKSPIKDWTKAPPPAKEPAWKPPVAKRSKLKNGMALVVVENKTLPIASLMLVVPGAGSASDPAGKGGLAAFTADLLDEGAGGLGALAIAEEQARLGATLGTSVDADSAYVSATILSKALDPSLALLTKIVTQPAFVPAEVDRVKADRVTALELRRDRPREVASIVLHGSLYGFQSAYGHPTGGTRDELKGVALADAQAFYQERWTPATMTLVVVGDVDARALQRTLDAGLGAWKQPGKPAPKVDVKPAPSKRLLLVDRPGAAQSDVRIGMIGPDRKDPRYFSFEVLRTVLGDGFTSRITQKLREEMGIIYNGSASMGWRLKPGPFVIGMAIQTPDTARGLAEIVKMLDDLATNDVPAAELEKSKQNIIRTLPALFDTNTSTASTFAELVVHGLPLDYYATYAGKVRRVTAKDVKATAKATMPSGKMVFSVVGDLAKTRAELDKLGLGEAAMFDAYGVAK